MALIRCKFLDDNNTPKGRSYTYGSYEEVVEGEIVATSEGKRLVVVSTDVPDEEAEKYGDNLKYVNTIIETETTEVSEKVPDNVQDDFVKKDLIVLTQLPIIVEQLQSLSTHIDDKVNAAISLVCTEETVKDIKKVRTDLNNTFLALEEKRKEIKNAIMAPYEEFNDIYKEYVSDKIAKADNTLKSRIYEVEDNLKSKKEDEVKSYFNEYLTSKNIDFISYKDAGINVTLSASLKSLKEKAKEFIDRIADDIALIDTQDFKEEIFVEYKKSMNCSQAITTVTARHKAIEEQKARQVELEAKRQAQAEAVKKVEATAPAVDFNPLEPPKQVNETIVTDPVKTLSFKVTAPLSKLKELKVFLENGGYTYE